MRKHDILKHERQSRSSKKSSNNWSPKWPDGELDHKQGRVGILDHLEAHRLGPRIVDTVLHVHANEDGIADLGQMTVGLKSRSLPSPNKA